MRRMRRARALDARQPSYERFFVVDDVDVAKPSATSSRRVANVLVVRLLSVPRLACAPEPRQGARVAQARRIVRRGCLRTGRNARIRGWRGPAAGGCRARPQVFEQAREQRRGQHLRAPVARECARQCTRELRERAQRVGRTLDRLRVPDAPRPQRRRRLSAVRDRKRRVRALEASFLGRRRHLLVVEGGDRAAAARCRAPAAAAYRRATTDRRRGRAEVSPSLRTRGSLTPSSSASATTK